MALFIYKEESHRKKNYIIIRISTKLHNQYQDRQRSSKNKFTLNLNIGVFLLKVRRSVSGPSKLSREIG